MNCNSIVTYWISCFSLTVVVFSDFAGPNKHTLTQIKDAVHDGLRAVKNAIEDGKKKRGLKHFFQYLFHKQLPVVLLMSCR